MPLRATVSLHNGHFQKLQHLRHPKALQGRPEGCCTVQANMPQEPNDGCGQEDWLRCALRQS